MHADHGGAQPPNKAHVTVYDDHFNETVVDVDKNATGAALTAAAAIPGATMVLQQLKRGGLQRVSMEQVLQLEQGSTFFLLPGEKTFPFSIDADGYEWPVAQVMVALILKLASKKDSGVDLVQHTEGMADTVLEPDEVVTLTGAGAGATFVTKPAKKTVTVYYGPDETPFELERRVYKSEELLRKFDVEAGYVLDVIFHNQFTALAPGAEIRVKEGMKFTSHPPVGHSS